MMRRVFAMLAALFLAAPGHALASGPEQLEQLEPGAGEWQTEYFGMVGRGGGREHSLEAVYGIGGRLALGLELQTEYDRGALAFDTVGPKLLYRFSGEDAPVAVGLEVQLGFDAGAGLAEAEARLIVAARLRGWWAQGNVMLRRSSDAGEAETGFAYAASLQHSLGPVVWLGIETSGQSAPLWREGAARGAHGHFAGPSLTFACAPVRGHETEIGLAWLRRIGGEGPAGSGRLFVQFGF